MIRTFLTLFAVVASAFFQTASAQSDGLKVDIDALRASIFGEDGTPPFVAMLGIPPEVGSAAFESNGIPAPELKLAKDGLTATLGYSIPGQGRTLFDGNENLDVHLLFTPISAEQYRFDLVGAPTRMTPADEDLAGQFIEVNDLEMSGLWNLVVGLPETLGFKLGSVVTNIDGANFEFGSMEMFVGALSDYAGEFEVDPRDLEPSTAQVWIFDMEPMRLEINDFGTKILVDFEGATGGAITGYASGDDRQVPSAIAGSPELMQWSQDLNRLNFEMTMNGADEEEQIMAMLALYGQIGDLLEPYYGLGSYASFQIGALNAVNGNMFTPLNLEMEGAELISETSPSVPADSKLSLRFLPMSVATGDEFQYSLDGAELSFDASAVNLPNMMKHLSALFDDDGNWGDLSGILVDGIDGFSETISISGLTFSAAEFGQTDGVNGTLEIGSADLGIGLTGLGSDDGTHVFLNYGAEGIVLPAGLVGIESLFGQLYADQGKQGLADIVPNGFSAAATLSGIPVRAWHEQLAAVPRQNGLNDPEAFAQETEILSALVFQFMAPLIESPPTVSADMAVISPISRMDVAAEFAVNPMAPPTFGTGDGVVMLSNGDKLLQRLLSVEKQVDKMLQRSPDNFGYEDFEFAEMISGLSTSLRYLRSIAEKQDGDYRFVVKTDPVDLVTINDLPVEEVGRRLAQ